MDSSTDSRLLKLTEAFRADGFRINRKVNTATGRLGIEAIHITAKNRDTGLMKKIYYVEGTPYERGRLLGLLAEPQISEIVLKFANNIIFDLAGLDVLNSFTVLQELLVSLVYERSRKTWASQPQHVREELHGLHDGCRLSNLFTHVTKQRLIAVNTGFDVICALLYTGRLFEGIIPHPSPEYIKLPMLCNAFSVFGSAAAGGHYFMRDFMFSSGGVMQNNISHIINVPFPLPGEKLYPYISVTAPGLIGSISAMNARGVAGGLNMSPAANCDSNNIGFNSLLLLRECVMRGGSAAEAAEVILNARRGVSWNYALSDGTNDTACTVEAGASSESIDFLSYPAKELLPLLPDAEYLLKHSPSPVVNGAMVRWCGSPFPESYLDFNKGLWEHYNITNAEKILLRHDAFSPDGYINRASGEKNCPSSLYFAPQRTGREVFITTNHFLMPHMRLCSMHPWTSGIIRGYANDIQWRYDELNKEINEALSQDAINYAAAKRLADFLSPYGNFPHYYQNNPKSSDGKDIRIEGCTSLFDLKNRTAESHYGYFTDEWVKTSLPAYIV